MHFLEASLRQLEIATIQIAKIYIHSLELLWLFMLQYYPEHSEKFKKKILLEYSQECINQMKALGLESKGLTNLL